MEETVRYICAAASINCEEQIFVPEVGEAVKIIDLANFLIEHAGGSDGCEATISYSGLRPGDKLSEELIFGDEKLEPTDVDGLYTVEGPVIAKEQILECLAELGEVIERRDLAELLHFVGHIVLQETTQEADALFAALAKLPGQILFCYPNVDAGSRELIGRAESFVSAQNRGKIFVNLDALTYWSLLRQVHLMPGNSSSGIIETASFAVPTVNVGLRQRGRERAQNVLDADATTHSILQQVSMARSEEFRRSLVGIVNPYGDGRASEKIVSVLTSLPLGQELLIKRSAL
jgi:hypothetical protein